MHTRLPPDSLTSLHFKPFDPQLMVCSTDGVAGCRSERGGCLSGGSGEGEGSLLTEGGTEGMKHAMRHAFLVPMCSHNSHTPSSPSHPPSRACRSIGPNRPPHAAKTPGSFAAAADWRRQTTKGVRQGGIMQCLERAPPKRRLPAA